MYLFFTRQASRVAKHFIQARRNEEKDTRDMIKKRVKKYNKEQLITELEVLGVSLDDGIRKERKNKRKKKNLQKLLIWEEIRRATYSGPEWVKENTERPSLPYPVPKDIMDVLNELDALNKMDNPLSTVKVEKGQEPVLEIMIMKDLGASQGVTLVCPKHLNEEEVDKMAKNDVDSIRKSPEKLGSGEGRDLHVKKAEENIHLEGSDKALAQTQDGEAKT